MATLEKVIESFQDIEKEKLEILWKEINVGQIRNQKIAEDLIFFSIFFGVEESVKCLQRSYNLLNKRQNLKVDGILGEKTSSVINNYKFYKSLYKVFIILQGEYFVNKCEDDLEEKEFFRVWINSHI